MPVGFMGHKRHPQKDFLLALSARRHRRALAALLAIPAPATWDSRTHGWVGPIKNQKSCGSCWDFSGVFMVEAAFYKAGLLKPDGSQALSEEYVLSCGSNGGCNGDDNVTVLDMAKAKGLPLTSDYGPYTASAGHCAFTPKMTLYKIDDYVFCDAQGGQGVASPDTIQACVMAHGGVGSGVSAGGDGFWNDGQGVGTGRGGGINHDVGIVGWRTEGTKVSALTGPQGVGMPSVATAVLDWLMRNSWDVVWGEQGYAWVRQGAYGLGTEACSAVVNGSAPNIDWGDIFP